MREPSPTHAIVVRVLRRLRRASRRRATPMVPLVPSTVAVAVAVEVAVGAELAGVGDGLGEAAEVGLSGTVADEVGLADAGPGASR